MDLPTAKILAVLRLKDNIKYANLNFE